MEKALGGVRSGVWVDEGRLCLYLKGPAVFLRNNLVQLFSFARKSILTKEGFEKIQEEYLDRYEGDPDPMSYANQVFDAIVFSNGYTKMDLYQGVLDLTYEEYLDFLQVNFEAAFIESSFAGAISKEEVLSLVETLYATFPFASYQDMQEEEGELFFLDRPLILYKNTHRYGSALLLAVGAEEEIDSAAYGIINRLLQSLFYQELRTSQQIGYAIDNSRGRVENHSFLTFKIESSTHDPEDLLTRVELFLSEFAEDIESSFSQERMELIRNTLICTCEELVRKGDVDSEEIEEYLEDLKSVSLDEVIDVAKKIFSMENPKKVAILIKGEGCSSAN